ncbi:MAG TPA: hypothetical protein VIL20_16205 [Sandaracinaceae bacterium]
MRGAQDARFREERSRLGFRFTCEDCAFFDPAAESCSHGYPTGEHRAARYEDPSAGLVFCKEWESR